MEKKTWRRKHGAMKYSNIFQVTSEFPPISGHEHAIVRRKGPELVNVQPFRYPQFQKDEIERLVKEMLEAGIIHPSVSPYSNLVLLVKKCDVSWRFCMI